MNRNGGFYIPGVRYGLDTKARVAFIIQQHQEECFPDNINIKAVTEEALVSRKFVYSVLAELEEDGIADPYFKPYIQPHRPVVCGMLTFEQEYFLLALRFENPARSNKDYCINLLDNYGDKISESSVSNFFLRRFDNEGKYKKPNLVPVDKFKPANRTRYYEFLAKVQQLSNHTKWKFFDEKHLANKDTLADRVRANPLTGQVNCIPVSGDF